MRGGRFIATSAAIVTGVFLILNIDEEILD